MVAWLQDARLASIAKIVYHTWQMKMVTKTLYKMTEMYERNLPPYLAHDLEAWKKGVEEKSRFLDCLWGELYGSINIAEINDGAITHDQAQYLRDKYLWGKDV